MRKVEKIIREEMDRAGAVEVLMPALQPKEIWEQSGRAETASNVLFKVKDGSNREWFLSPTAEEVITTLAASAQHRLEYALEGSIFIGGAVVQWLRDNLKLIGSSADVETLAASVPDTGGVVFVPAFVGLGAPHWDPHAGGLIIGLRRDTKPCLLYTSRCV